MRPLVTEDTGDGKSVKLHTRLSPRAPPIAGHSRCIRGLTGLRKKVRALNTSELCRRCWGDLDRNAREREDAVERQAVRK